MNTESNLWSRSRFINVTGAGDVPNLADSETLIGWSAVCYNVEKGVKLNFNAPIGALVLSLLFCEEKKTQQQNTLIISFVGGGLSQSGSESY